MVIEKRLIDANYLKDRLWFLFRWAGQLPCSEEDKRTQQTIKKCIAEVDKIPTMDAVPVVHGEWLDGWAVDQRTGDKVYDSIDCSVCEEVFKIESHDREYWKGRFKRCFCCGAVMDGVHEDSK